MHSLKGVLMHADPLALIQASEVSINVQFANSGIQVDILHERETPRQNVVVRKYQYSLKVRKYYCPPSREVQELIVFREGKMASLFNGI